eukprot:6939729-Heterocapsa_arctica.AAC.1
MGCSWKKVSSFSRSQGTGPESATVVLEMAFVRCFWLRPECGIRSRRCRTDAIDTGSRPSGSSCWGSQVECTLVHAPVSVPCSMHRAAPGRTVGAGNCGTRRKWM